MREYVRSRTPYLLVVCGAVDDDQGRRGKLPCCSCHWGATCVERSQDKVNGGDHWTCPTRGVTHSSLSPPYSLAAGDVSGKFSALWSSSWRTAPSHPSLLPSRGRACIWTHPLQPESYRERGGDTVYVCSHVWFNSANCAVSDSHECDLGAYCTVRMLRVYRPIITTCMGM